MRGLLIVVAGVLLVVALVSAGWVTFNRDDDRTTITIDKTEVRQDVRDVKEKGARALEEAADTIDSDRHEEPRP
jgi:hypothetical protein